MLVAEALRSASFWLEGIWGQRSQAEDLSTRLFTRGVISLALSNYQKGFTVLSISPCVRLRGVEGLNATV